MVIVTKKTCVPSDVYPYVYQFLISNEFTKAAKYFKKEVGSDIIIPAGPNLMEILDSYFQRTESNVEKKEIDDNENENSKTHVNNDLKKKKKKRKSESSDNVNDIKKAKLDKTEEDGEDTKEKKEKSADKKSKTKKKDKKKKKKIIAGDDSEENEKDKSDDEIIDKKTNEQDNDQLEENNINDENTAPKQQLKNAPFRRVISESVDVPNNLRDNSFEAKIGASGDWGEKANLDLKYTKGKSFRHEKTKKKRGSYKGGNINTSVNSIKFDDSD